jgi:hypothetical protein
LPNTNSFYDFQRLFKCYLLFSAKEIKRNMAQRQYQKIARATYSLDQILAGQPGKTTSATDNQEFVSCDERFYSREYLPCDGSLCANGKFRKYLNEPKSWLTRAIHCEEASPGNLLIST